MHKRSNTQYSKKMFRTTLSTSSLNVREVIKHAYPNLNECIKYINDDEYTQLELLLQSLEDTTISDNQFIQAMNKFYNLQTNYNIMQQQLSTYKSKYDPPVIQIKQHVKVDMDAVLLLYISKYGYPEDDVFKCDLCNEIAESLSK